MQTLRLTFLLILAALVFPEMACAQHAKPLCRQETAAILDSLDVYLERSPEFDLRARRKVRIRRNYLRRHPGKEPEMAYLEIGNIYSLLDIDSAIHFYDLGLAMHATRPGAPDANRLRLQMARLRMLPPKGLVHQALQGLKMLSLTERDSNLRGEYFYTAHQIYRYAADAYAPDTTKQRYTRMAVEALDSLNCNLRGHSPQAEYLRVALQMSSPRRMNRETARRRLLAVLDTLPIIDEQYALITAVLSRYALQDNDIEEAKHMLALSAMSDLARGNAEITSLHRLGRLLYEQDPEDERAYRYITASLQRTSRAGVRLRTLEVAEALPMVMAKSEQRLHRYITLTYVAIGISILLAAALVWLILQRRMRLREKSTAAHTLEDSRRAMYHHIEQLLNMCADNMDTVQAYERDGATKMRLQQTQSVLNNFENHVLSEKTVRNFNSVFDRAFLDASPNFIAQVNELLHPDRRFPETSDGTLSTELRILALMKLGVAESSQMAKFLGLSVNSVYSYRTKLKSRAKNRNTFEEDVLKNIKFA